jgi:hypothetical protein
MPVRINGDSGAGAVLRSEVAGVHRSLGALGFRKGTRAAIVNVFAARRGLILPPSIKRAAEAALELLM